MATAPSPFGQQLRTWRQRRRLSQLALALEAGVSSRHLSFLESGRARPSRSMVLHLASSLAVPLRQQNAMLLAAGFAPAFAERKLDAPELKQVGAALDRALAQQEPFPALIVDRVYNLIRAFGPNPAAGQAHYEHYGRAEGRRPDTFDERQYLAGYPDLRAAFGADGTAATIHYIQHGFGEGQQHPASTTPSLHDRPRMRSSAVA